MKRFRVKLVGFGLAALAGSAVAADKDWLPVPQPAGSVVPAGGDIHIPASVLRLAAATEPAAVPEPIWFPAAKAPAPPAPVVAPPAPLPDLRASPPAPTTPIPVIKPLEPVANQGPAVGPRIGSLPPEPAREVPEWLPPPAPVPPPPVNTQPTLPIPVAPEVSQPPGSDSPVPGQIRPMPQPTPPGAIRPRLPDELPVPRTIGPLMQPSGTELPTAPPELMVPDCVPAKHGGFGSPPIRLGSDYPSLAELCGRPIRDWFATRHADGATGSPRGFIEGEYLLWWMPGLHIPVLATTSTNPAQFGFLGESGTVPILGPGNFIDEFRQGLRIRGGLWLDDCGKCAIDGSVFFLGRRTADATFSSSEFGVITRPIFSPNIQPGIGFVGQTGEAVAVPNILAGALSAHAESFLWGADLNIRHCLLSGCDWNLMGFAGYRFLNLSESLSITENITVVGPSEGRVLISDPVGSVVLVRDSFKTENWFNGGQLGLTYERRRGRFDIDARASIAFGETHEELEISGVQVRTRPGQAPATFNGGLLAVGPNLGTFTRDRFSVVPEFTMNLGYWVTPNLKAYVGYNFLYWSNVIRPGNQIDPVVDLSFVPNAPAVAPSGQLRPQPLFRQSDLWVTGVQFGLQWRW